jgi:hypothetical protein
MAPEQTSAPPASQAATPISAISLASMAIMAASVLLPRDRRWAETKGICRLLLWL